MPRSIPDASSESSLDSRCQILDASSRRGQTLMEILVGVAIGAVLIGSAVSVILPALTINKRAIQVQTGAALGKELLDNVRVWSEGDWHNILNLSTGTAKTYFLQTAQSPFVAASGTEYISSDNVTSGLVGWWKFDEGSGSSTVDSSGGGNAGTWNGTATGTAGTYYSVGRIGQYAGDFDGSTNYVSYASAGVAPGSNVTISMWIKPATAGTEALYNFGVKSGCNPSSQTLRFTVSKTLNFATGCGTVLAPTTTMSLGTWYQVAATIDSSGLTTLFINGAALNVPTSTRSGQSVAMGNDTIGAAYSGGVLGSYFNGLIDDVRVYNRVLSSSEINAIYQSAYQRYLYLSDVQRNAAGAIVTSGGTYDPSTKLVTVVYGAFSEPTSSISTYLTRHGDNVYRQTDWSGGSGASGPTTTTNSQFSTSSNLSFNATAGSLSIASILASSTSSSSGYTNGYALRKTITITAADVSGTLSNFPVLISGTYSYLEASSSGGSVQNPNGYDVIFTSDASGTTQLAYERESYASSSGAVNYWVQVPTLSSSSNVFYMFYDNASTTTDQSNATGVWTANYAAVYHLDQNPTGTAPQFLDSTTNGVNLTVQTAHQGAQSNPSSVAGQIGNSVYFPTANQYNGTYASSSANSGLGTGTALTVSAWMNFNSFVALDLNGNNYMFGARSYFDIQDNYNNASQYPVCTLNGNSNSYYALPTYTFATSTWYYIACTLSGTSIDMYINGALSATGTVSADTFNDHPVTAGGGDRYLDMKLDEARLSTATRSSGWILTEYNNQSNPSAFYTIN